MGYPNLPHILPVTKPDGQIIGVPIPPYIYSTAKLFAKKSWDVRTPQIIVSDDNHYYPRCCVFRKTSWDKNDEKKVVTLYELSKCIHIKMKYQ